MSKYIGVLSVAQGETSVLDRRSKPMSRTAAVSWVQQQMAAVPLDKAWDDCVAQVMEYERFRDEEQ